MCYLYTYVGGVIAAEEKEKKRIGGEVVATPPLRISHL
jgi:hypothetical protein